MFVCGLSSSHNGEFRTWLLATLDNDESENKLKLTDLINECRRINQLKHDTSLIEKHKRNV